MKQNIFLHVKAVFKSITVEPLAFLFVFSFGICIPVVPSFIVYRVCTGDLFYNSSICENLPIYDEIQSEVQIIANNIMTYKSCLEVIPSVLIALIIGPWSDENGRKPIILLPLLSNILSQIIYILIIFLPNLSAYYILLTAVNGLGGGFQCILIGLFSYMSDITSTEARTKRIAVLDLFILTALPSSTFLSGLVFQKLGYLGVFLISSCLLFLSLLYFLIFIKESIVKTSVSYIPKIGMLGSPFQVAFKKRSSGKRFIILTLILVVSLKVASSGVNTYMFVNKVLGWQEIEYANFVALSIVISVLGTYVSLPLFTRFFSDVTIILISLISDISSRILQGFSVTSFMMYGSIFVGMYGFLGTISTRSLLSKIVSKEDTGKIFSLLAALETAAPFLSVSFCNALYNATMNTVPGSPFFLVASFSSIGLILLVFMYVKTPSFTHISNEKTNEDSDVTVHL